MPASNRTEPRAISRRQLMEGSAAIGLAQANSGAAASDPALHLSRQWLRLDDEVRRLILEWQRLETYLFEHHAWPKLTARQQRQLPAAAPLFAINGRLGDLYGARQELLPELQEALATSRLGAIGKLAALASLLDTTDHPEAHALLRSAQADINRLWV